MFPQLPFNFYSPKKLTYAVSNLVIPVTSLNTILGDVKSANSDLLIDPANLVGNLSDIKPANSDLLVANTLLSSNLSDMKFANSDLIISQIVSTVNISTYWTPSAISTQLWYDAADASTITLSGSSVLSISSKSGASNTATPNTTSPILVANQQNGLPVIRLNGTSDLLISQSIANNGFWITACNPSGAQNFGSIVGFNNKHGLIRDTVTANWYFSVSSLFNSTNAFRNGASSTTIGFVPSIFSNGGTAIASTILTVGDDFVGGNFISGDIYEIVILATYPDLTTRQKLEGYLAHKWGLTANLPSNHPYKTTPPLV